MKIQLHGYSYFNPRTPCGVRRYVEDDENEEGQYINPRTPCGVRHDIHAHLAKQDEFQSTHPVRGATQTWRTCSYVPRISIHAPRAGCDLHPLVKLPPDYDFNPRTPCGVRRQTCTTWFAPIFATLPNQMYVCLHYTCFTTLFQPKTWFSAVFQRCEAPRESMFASASHRVKASAIPPAHRSAWRRYAQRGSDSYSQDCKSAGCPSPG